MGGTTGQTGMPGCVSPDRIVQKWSSGCFPPQNRKDRGARRIGTIDRVTERSSSDRTYLKKRQLPKRCTMSSEPIRDPVTDHLLTPQNSALIIIDYQPTRVTLGTGYKRS